ncbi:MAG: hypothetical protein Q9215_004903 [Flavoplaca cf. flavocitrina]
MRKRSFSSAEPLSQCKFSGRSNYQKLAPSVSWIGEEVSGFHIGAERHYALGDLFSSVREYLPAYSRYSLEALDKQQAIKVYRERFQDRGQVFVDRHLDVIPQVVEDIFVVAIHTDIGLYNIVVSSETPTEIRTSTICLPPFNDREAIPPTRR